MKDPRSLILISRSESIVVFGMLSIVPTTSGRTRPRSTCSCSANISGVECTSSLCSYIIHPGNQYPRGGFTSMTWTLPCDDYDQVRFEVTGQGWNKDFLNDFGPLLHGCQFLLYEISDFIMPSDYLGFREYAQTQYMDQCFIAGSAFPAFHVRLRYHLVFG